MEKKKNRSQGIIDHVNILARAAILIRNHYELSIHRRGEILSECIFLERYIDDFIANYFCGVREDKTEKMLDLILYAGKIGFKYKAATFKSIVYDLEDEVWFKKKEIDELCTTIHTIVDFRNKLAHRSVDLDFVNMKAGVTEFKEKFKEKGETLDANTFNEWIDKIKACSNKVFELVIRLRVKSGLPDI